MDHKITVINIISMNAYKQIRLGAILSYVSIAVNIFTGLLYTPWMVASIGKSQYGLYTLANSVISLFLVDFGLSSATGRYLSKYNAEGDRESAERFLGAVYKLYLLIDAAILVVLIAVFFLMDKIFVNLTAEELEQFRVVYTISAVFSLVNFPFVTFNGILTAYEKFVPLKIADLLYRLVNVGFSAIVLLLDYGLYALVTVHAVAGLVMMVFKYIVIHRSISLKINFRGISDDLYKEIFRFSFWVTVSSLAARLVIGITPAILGVTADSEEIALFGVVTTIEGYSFVITSAIGGFFMTRISAALAKNDAEKTLNPLFLSVGKFQYLLLGIVIAGFAVNGKNFICLWMGDDYIESFFGIMLIIIPGLFCTPLQIASTMMTVMNKVRKMALVTVLTGIVNVCLAFPLSHRFGVIGACTSIAIAYMVRNVVQTILYHRELPLDIPRFMKECYVKMSVPILVTVGIGLGVNRFIPDGGWGIFLIKAAVTVIIYALTTLCFALNKQERQGLFRWMKK